MEIKVEDNLQRIDKYLVEQMDESRSTIAKMIDAEFILVNGKKTKANYVVKVGDVIEVKDGFIEDIDLEPENIPLDIIYEDDDVIVVNKKSGMTVHPGNGNERGTLVNALLYHTNNLSDCNGDIRPGIVHRIDKDTSGLMVVAKNNKAHEILADNLSRHEINREYIALLKGEFMSDTATVDAPIGRDAITHFRVIERYKGYTLVRLRLETGRTHQIRVHMDYIGYPVYNDPVYTNDKCSEFGQFLHSTSLSFVHPITGEELNFEVEVPEEFQSFIDTLEKK